MNPRDHGSPARAESTGLPLRQADETENYGGIGQPVGERDIRPLPAEPVARRAVQLLGLRLVAEYLDVPTERLELVFARGEPVASRRLVQLGEALTRINEAMDEG
jgi:hypothetical protein